MFCEVTRMLYLLCQSVLTEVKSVKTLFSSKLKKMLNLYNHLTLA